LDQYDWYQLFNLEGFLDTGLVSRTLTVNLQGIGTRDILVVRGVGVSIVFDGITLMVNLNDRNPFKFEDHAVFLDDDQNVWLGIKIQ